MIKFFAIWISITLLEFHFGRTNVIGRDNNYVAFYVGLSHFFFLIDMTICFAAPAFLSTGVKLKSH